MANKKNASNSKYRSAHTKTMAIRFFINTPGEKELLDHCNSKENRNAYIKRLIREDMERNA